MRLVTPERWYIAFWLLMGLGFLACQYWIVRMAVAAGINDALRAQRPTIQASNNRAIGVN